MRVARIVLILSDFLVQRINNKDFLIGAAPSQLMFGYMKIVFTEAQLGDYRLFVDINNKTTIQDCGILIQKSRRRSVLMEIAKEYDIKSSIAEKLSPYCFCVYLIHTIFINISYKILHITPLNILGDTSISITIPLFFIIFTILSFASAYILAKIPFLKKHVL